jgi:alpha-L-rhamnosidase
MEYLWICKEENRQDTYVAFRGTFYLDKDVELVIKTLGASWYRIWIDDVFLNEGPFRFDREHPQHEQNQIKLEEGNHVIAAQVHNIGLATRMLATYHPFFACEIMKGGSMVEIDWKCFQLDGYKSKVRRLNPELGWIEYCDLRQVPLNWHMLEYDDMAWSVPVSVELEIAEPTAVTVASVQSFETAAELIGSGPLAATFGYEGDDIPAVFFLRDLLCEKYPSEGIWRRYDLGKVRLFCPSFAIEAQAGTIVEFAYAEQLTNGRVAPYIPLSAGPSCNLDHYVCREGKQLISPLTPRGGRFIELHILGNSDKVVIHDEKFIERGYYGEAQGYFETEEPLLNRIWKVGIETFRSCSEDTIIDNPTRERGQWTGDVVSVGMDICSAAYFDYGPLRRGLQQSAWCSRVDGLIAGMCPGETIYLTTYALQWLDACYNFYTLTGDKSLLEEMYPYAEKNICYFINKWTDGGLKRDLDWGFIDWGYVTNEGPSDMAINLYLLSGVSSLIKWCKTIGKTDTINNLEIWKTKIKKIITGYITSCLEEGSEGWNKIGFHRTALSLKEGLFSDEQSKEAVKFIKKHYLNCFPNNLEAPRLGKPSDANAQLITPYFSHFVFPELIQHGEMDFVLAQYRKCWGWALQDGRTTWLEVFDTRWSHCHQWSGCPTWQLSRYVLGLKPRFDIGMNCFELNLQPGSLSKAIGRIPNPNTERTIDIEWKREGTYIKYEVNTATPITILFNNKEINIEDKLELDLALRGCDLCLL